jgi:MFS family permease
MILSRGEGDGVSDGRAAKEGGLWTKSYLALLAVNLLLCFGFYMLPPTLPAYVKEIGGSNLQASLVFGMFSFTSLVMRIIAGSLVDAKGEKTIMLLGMVIVAACTVAFVWLPVNGILLLRCFQGAGWGMATAAIAAAVYKVVPEARRGEGGGYYSLTTIVSLSLTPMAAILLMNNLGFAHVMLLAGALVVAGVAGLAGGLARLPLPARPAAGRDISWESVFEKGAVLPSVLCFLLSVPLCGIMGFLLLFGKEVRLDNVWLFFVGYTAAILATRRFVGRLFDRRGHGVIILPGGILMILGLVTLANTASTPMLVAASLLYGLGYGAVQPSLQTWAVNRCPPDRKGAANGLFLSSIDLGYLVGSIPLAYVGGLDGYAAMYGYSAWVMVLFLAVYGLAVIKGQH